MTTELNQKPMGFFPKLHIWFKRRDDFLDKVKKNLIFSMGVQFELGELMELVIILLLANTVGLGFLLFWVKRSLDSHAETKNELGVISREMNGIFQQYLKSYSELRKVHQLCFEARNYSFDTCIGMPALHGAAGSKWDWLKHDEAQSADRRAYVKENLPL